MVDLTSRIAEIRVTGLADQMRAAPADAEDCCPEIVNVPVLYSVCSLGVPVHLINQV
jgi:hypothetical protein